MFTLYGGEGGIRTREAVAHLHAFQACSFGHSDTSPPRLREGDQTCLNPGKYCYWEMALHINTEGARFELA